VTIWRSAASWWHQDRIFAYLGRLGVDSAMAPSNKYLSKGLPRSRTDNLVVMRSAPEPATEARGQGNVTAIASHGPTARSSDAIEGAPR
jgi:hypothetical protein